MGALLAKSLHGGSVVSLHEHSRTVADSGCALFGRPGCGLTGLGQQWFVAFGLPAAHAELFLRTLHVSAWLHDLGKAAESFQEAVTSGKTQRLRHEHISALLLTDPSLAEWLESMPEVDQNAVLAAVCGHHLKSPRETFAIPAQEGPFRVRVALDSPEVSWMLDGLAATLLDAPHKPSLKPVQWGDSDVFSRRVAFLRRADSVRRANRETPQQSRFIAAVRAALIAADAVGSAVTRENLNLNDWVSSCFPSAPLTSEWIEEHVIAPRIRQIEAGNASSFRWQQFQSAAEDLGRRGLLIAPCGTGKTLAAWKWVKAVLASHAAGRVVFLYPTRGTATEGFRDYVSWAGGENAALVHGTSDFDIHGMFDNPDDPRHGEFDQQRQRLFALSYWNRRVFSATVDQFLGFLQHQYASLCLMPVLCDSVLVIDEVHSFDRSMFTALERFLRAFRVPTLCMTATLPRDRVRVLVSACELQVFPSSEDVFPDLAQQSEAPRYRVRLGTEAGALETAVEAAAEGQKVLWVLNVVRRCQEAFAQLRSRLAGVRVLCYHSRFCLRDRRERHEAVIAAFRRPGPVVVVSTQVCEMSLDLDADVLVSEYAPLPSLIQRMGRCYRRRVSEVGGFGEVLLYPPLTVLPYEAAEIEQATAFMADLAARSSSVSQAELARLLGEIEVLSPAATDGFAAFLDAGMLASSREASFRESEDYTVDCILDNDVDAWIAANRRRDPLAQGYVLPAPRSLATRDPRLPNHLRVAPASHYDSLTGLQFQEVLHHA